VLRWKSTSSNGSRLLNPTSPPAAPAASRASPRLPTLELRRVGAPEQLSAAYLRPMAAGLCSAEEVRQDLDESVWLFDVREMAHAPA
jgi:hypothetical protein